MALTNIIYNDLTHHTKNTPCPVVATPSFGNSVGKSSTWARLFYVMPISGIYKITHINSGKFYIGSSCDILSRIRQHRWHLKNVSHKSKPMQNIFNKHGWDAFRIEIIATCPREYNLKLEDYFLRTLNPQFNTSKTIVNFQGCRHSEETKAIISKQSIARFSERPIRDRLWTDEEKKRIGRQSSIRNRGMGNPRYGKPAPTRRKVLQIKDGLVIKTYDSISEAANYINAKVSNIVACCQQKQRTAKGYSWQYAS